MDRFFPALENFSVFLLGSSRCRACKVSFLFEFWLVLVCFVISLSAYMYMVNLAVLLSGFSVVKSISYLDFRNHSGSDFAHESKVVLDLCSLHGKASYFVVELESNVVKTGCNHSVNIFVRGL